MTLKCFKVSIIGNASVGKSSFLHRLINNDFIPNEEPTIGANYIIHTINIPQKNNDITIRLNIWDTAGQEKYFSLMPLYLRGAQIILIFFDLTDKKTFDKINSYWMDILKTTVEDKKCIFAIIGNKSDLVEQIEVSDIAVKNLIENCSLNIQYFKTSAKTGYNIHDCINILAYEKYKIINKLKKNKRKEEILDLKSSVPNSEIYKDFKYYQYCNC